MAQTADEYIADLQNNIDWLTFISQFNVELYRAYCKSENHSPKALEPHIDADFFVDLIRGMRALGDKYVADILDASPQVARRIPTRPLCAFLPTGDLNAWATCSENGEPVCILDFSLMGCLSVVSAGIAYGILAYRQVSEEDRIGSVAHLVLVEALLFLGLRSRLRAEIYKGHVCSIPKLHSNEHISHFATGIATHLLCFIVAHEVAHHALGHLSQMSAVAIRHRWSGLRIYTRSQEQEFEADLLGCQLLLAYLDKTKATARDAPAIAFVPLLFFDFLSLINDVEEVLTGKKSASVTHPPGNDRRVRLRRYLEVQHLAQWRDLYARVEDVFTSVRATEIGELIH